MGRQLSAVRLFTLAIVSLISASPAAAQDRVLAICGASTGKSVVDVGGRRLEWTDNGIASGSLTFVRLAEGGYDVIVTDSTATFGARQDGANVTSMPLGDDTNLTLVVRYPLGTVETYQLSLDAEGPGSLVWTQVKVVGATLGSLFAATCRRP